MVLAVDVVYAARGGDKTDISVLTVYSLKNPWHMAALC